MAVSTIKAGTKVKVVTISVTTNSYGQWTVSHFTQNYGVPISATCDLSVNVYAVIANVRSSDDLLVGFLKAYNDATDSIANKTCNVKIFYI